MDYPEKHNRHRYSTVTTKKIVQFFQCFGSGTGSGFRGLLDPDPGAEKKVKNVKYSQHNFIFSDLYNILSFN